MTTSVFPGAQDNDTTLIRVVGSDALLPAQHNNLNDAIQAIESTLLAGGPGTSKYLRQDMTFDIPTGTSGIPSHASVSLGSDLPITVANVPETLGTFSLGAGTYLVIGHGTWFDNVASDVFLDIYDGSSVVATAEITTSTGGHYYNLAVQAIVVLPSAGSILLRGYTDGSTSGNYCASGGSAGAVVATAMSMIQIA